MNTVIGILKVSVWRLISRLIGASRGSFSFLRGYQKVDSSQFAMYTGTYSPLTPSRFAVSYPVWIPWVETIQFSFSRELGSCSPEKMGLVDIQVREASLFLVLYLPGFNSLLLLITDPFWGSARRMVGLQWTLASQLPLWLLSCSLWPCGLLSFISFCHSDGDSGRTHWVIILPFTLQAEPPQKSNWRQKHESFIRTLRQAREVQQVIAKGGNPSDLPPILPAENPDYVQCSHCSRHFAPKVAERHIPKCKTIRNRPPPPRKHNSWVGNSRNLLK